MFFFPSRWSIWAFNKNDKVNLGYIVRPEPGAPGLIQTKRSFTGYPINWNDGQTARNCKFVGICLLVGPQDDANELLMEVTVEIV